MNNFDENDLFAAYFEARLSPQEQAAFEARLSTDQEFSNRFELHSNLLRIRQRRKNLHVIRQVLGKGKVPPAPPPLPKRKVLPICKYVNKLPRRYLLAACGLHVFLACLYLLRTQVPPQTAHPSTMAIQGGPYNMHTATKLPIASKHLPHANVEFKPHDDSLELFQREFKDDIPGSTLLVSSPDNQGDSSLWESSIHGPSLLTWLTAQAIEIPKKVDLQVWNRVTVAMKISLVTQGHPERIQRMVVMGDLDLQEPQYFNSQTLFLFFPCDPRKLDLQYVRISREGRKLILFINGKNYPIKSHGSMETLLSIS